MNEQNKIMISSNKCFITKVTIIGKILITDDICILAGKLLPICLKVYEIFLSIWEPRENNSSNIK